MVILLHPVDDALAGGVIDDTLAADGDRNGSALRRVLSLGFDRNCILAEDIQFAFSKRLLVQLAAFG